jgi:predicted SprT family Zn-dependent metalloprotease
MNIHKKTKLTPYDKQDIYRLYHKEKITVADLAKRFMVSRPVIYRILNKPSVISYDVDACKELQRAYIFFNEHLFNNELPNVLITLRRNKRTLGYFVPEQFTNKPIPTTSELVLNPDYFCERSLLDTLSTLAHEMCHIWQHYVSVIKSRKAYHNRAWSRKMELIGLMPSHNGLIGGKKIGQEMSHFIIKDGLFQQTVCNLLKNGFEISWYNKYSKSNSISVLAHVKKGTGTRCKFSCLSCGQNAWAKASANLNCGNCNKKMEFVKISS